MKYYRATVSVPGTDKVGDVDAYAENEDSLLALVRQYTNEPTAVLSNGQGYAQAKGWTAGRA